MLKLSLCITNYNRDVMTVESFRGMEAHPLIEEVVIADDCSEIACFNRLSSLVDGMKKVRLHRNQENLGMSVNKAKAVELAMNEWCILLDSDNVIDARYLDALAKHMEAFYLSPDVIYCPDFAEPRFDYRAFANYYITKFNALTLAGMRMFDCLMNTCNYVVHRDTYLDVYEFNAKMKGSDTIWMNYLWLKAGKTLYVVPGMRYFHRVHDGSGFLKDAKYNMEQAEAVMGMIKGLAVEAGN